MARKFYNGVDVQSQKVINLANGTSANDAVNYSQLQAAVAGLSGHGAVRAASTANVTVSSPGASIDGVTLSSGNRVLLKNQTTASENGVYVWNGASSAMTRATDGTTGNLNAGTAFYVDEGTANADTAWTLTTDDPITVGTTSLTFARFGAGTNYTAGTGLTLSSNQFAIDTALVVRKYVANVGDGSSTTITVTHNIGTLDVQAQIYLVSSGETVEADTVRTTTNAMTFTFAAAPASNAYRVVVQG